MPFGLNPADPTTRLILAGAVVVMSLGLVAWLLSRLRERRYARLRRHDLRRHADAMRMKQEEAQRLAVKILATSSTSSIVGFEIVRQIEAVFVEGLPSPPAAVEQLKAQAAAKGANAVINLEAVRLPSGKCVANGDAVIVRPLQQGSPPRTTATSS